MVDQNLQCVIFQDIHFLDNFYLFFFTPAGIVSCLISKLAKQ